MAHLLRIIFAGAGDFGQQALQNLHAAGHSIVQVVSQPDRPAGRGRHTVPTPISQTALALKLPRICTLDINAETLPSADVLVVIAFGQKIAADLANRYPLGSINLHASLLPKCRGAAPINWTILRGETQTGNSIIRLAEKMDAGDILAQSHLSIGPTETAGELHDRLAADGASLVAQVLDQLATGKAQPTIQNHAQATLAPKLGRKDTQLDFSSTSSQEIVNRIRGLYPWPGCRVRALDAAGNELSRFTLIRVCQTNGEGDRWHPGELTTTGGISVGSGQHALEVLDLQPEGKKPMRLLDYRNGHPWLPGMKLESVL